jgi:hypothetical protein
MDARFRWHGERFLYRPSDHPEPTDPHAVLGVSQSASFEEIKRAYRLLIRRYHPYVYMNSTVSSGGGEKFQTKRLINTLDKIHYQDILNVDEIVET